MSAYTGSQFNYAAIATGETVYIADASVSRINKINSSEYVNLNPDIYSAFVDFDLESIRNTHSY